MTSAAVETTPSLNSLMDELEIAAPPKLDPIETHLAELSLLGVQKTDAAQIVLGACLARKTIDVEEVAAVPESETAKGILRAKDLPESEFTLFPLASGPTTDPAREETTALSFLFDDEDAPELSWKEDALCAQTDPEAFFPEKGGSTKEAKRICNQCDVREECLNYALAGDERFGIWGGKSERERRRLKRQVG